MESKVNWKPFVVILLALVGLSVSAYLSIKQLEGAPLGPCPIFGGGCEDVIHSKYSTFLGIKLSYYGMLFYSLVIVCASLWAARRRWFRGLTALLALIGFVDSAIFIYIQGALIHAYCFYCVTSAVSATLIFFIMLPRLIDLALDLTSKKQELPPPDVGTL